MSPWFGKVLRSLAVSWDVGPGQSKQNICCTNLEHSKHIISNCLVQMRWKTLLLPHKPKAAGVMFVVSPYVCPSLCQSVSHRLSVTCITFVFFKWPHFLLVGLYSDMFAQPPGGTLVWIIKNKYRIVHVWPDLVMEDDVIWRHRTCNGPRVEAEK